MNIENTILVIANNDALKEECFKIREEVFCKEQNIPISEEKDSLDAVAHHYLLLHNNEYVATVRWYLKEGNVHIGRVAVLREHRGKNFGKAIMQGVIDDIKSKGVTKTIILSSQSYAKSFYQKLGFKEYGEEFIDVNITHIKMKLVII